MEGEAAHCVTGRASTTRVVKETGEAELHVREVLHERLYGGGAHCDAVVVDGIIVGEDLPHNR